MGVMRLAGFAAAQSILALLRNAEKTVMRKTRMPKWYPRFCGTARCQTRPKAYFLRLLRSWILFMKEIIIRDKHPDG